MEFYGVKLERDLRWDWDEIWSLCHKYCGAGNQSIMEFLNRLETMKCPNRQEWTDEIVSEQMCQNRLECLKVLDCLTSWDCLNTQLEWIRGLGKLWVVGGWWCIWKIASALVPFWDWDLRILIWDENLRDQGPELDNLNLCDVCEDFS